MLLNGQKKQRWLGQLCQVDMLEISSIHRTENQKYYLYYFILKRYTFTLNVSIRRPN